MKTTECRVYVRKKLEGGVEKIIPPYYEFYGQHSLSWKDHFEREKKERGDKYPIQEFLHQEGFIPIGETLYLLQS